MDNQQKMIGIDIGGTSIKFALLDSLGTIQEKWTIPTDISERGANIPGDICKSVRGILADKQVNEVAGIGIGVPGPVSSDGSTVVRAVNLDWEQLPLKRLIEEELGVNVCLLNDANAAALGEMWQGAAKGKSNLLFVTLGTGVGGGIVLKGEVLNGCHSAGGEIGHIPIRSEEHRLCGCGGRNCLETFASATGLVYSMTKKLKAANETWPKVTPPAIFDQAAKGHPLAQEALAEFVDILGQAIAGILNTIDVEEVVIGGGLSEAGAALLEPLTKAINQYAFPQIRGHISVKKAQLGNDAGMYGAVYAHLFSKTRKKEGCEPLPAQSV